VTESSAFYAGGGKNDVPNRLKRQFACFNVPLPSVAAINGIFGKLMEGRFSSDVFTDEVVQVRDTHPLLKGTHLLSQQGYLDLNMIITRLLLHVVS
jgi:hypothetical protein